MVIHRALQVSARGFPLTNEILANRLDRFEIITLTRRRHNNISTGHGLRSLLHAGRQTGRRTDTSRVHNVCTGCRNHSRSASGRLFYACHDRVPFSQWRLAINRGTHGRWRSWGAVGWWRRPLWYELCWWGGDWLRRFEVACKCCDGPRPRLNVSVLVARAASTQSFAIVVLS